VTPALVAGVALLRAALLRSRMHESRARVWRRTRVREIVLVPELPTDRRTKTNVIAEQQIFPSIGAVQGNGQNRLPL